MGIPQAQMTNFDIRNISVYLRIANLERETANNYHNAPNSRNELLKNRRSFHRTRELQLGIRDLRLNKIKNIL